jgi:hemolysin D
MSMNRDGLPMKGRGPGRQQLPAPVSGQQLPGPAGRKLPAPADRKNELKRTRPGPLPLEHFAQVQPDRDAGDREFLPAALEILETPASPTRTALIYALCGMLTAALAWSWFGHLDVYADAPGKFQATGRTKVIQPLDPGTVIAIKAKDGDHVKQGDVLIQLDPTAVLADQSVARNKLLSGRAEIMRRRVAIAEAGKDKIDTKVPITWDAEIPKDVREREESALRADLASLVATLDSLAAQKKEKEAERDKAANSMESQKKVIDLIIEHVGMRQKLADQGWNSRAQLIELLQQQRAAELTLTSLDGQRMDAIAQIAVIESNIVKTRQTFISTNIEQLVSEDRQVQDFAQQLAKATSKVTQTTLKAPIDGIIQATAVTTIGQVVSPGQQLMQIVPEGTPLEIQAYVLNTDIGFVSVGQDAIIQVDAFPFTRYGTIAGTVTQVAVDALPGKQGQQQQKDASKPPSNSGQLSVTTAAEQTSDLVYPVTIVPKRLTMRIGDKDIPLVSGMTAMVQIRTESRRAIDYILSPVVQALSNAAQER